MDMIFNAILQLNCYAVPELYPRPGIPYITVYDPLDVVALVIVQML